jgi:hypothetical protein
MLAAFQVCWPTKLLQFLEAEKIVCGGFLTFLAKTPKNAKPNTP